jgi:hypothetical protein
MRTQSDSENVLGVSPFQAAVGGGQGTRQGVSALYPQCVCVCVCVHARAQQHVDGERDEGVDFIYLFKLSLIDLSL